MSTIRHRVLFPHRSTNRAITATFALLLAAAPFTAAQVDQTGKVSADVITANVRLDLPDSPDLRFSSSTDATNTPADTNDSSFDQTAATAATATNLKHSAHLQMVIAPGEIADPMTVHEKIVGGLKDSVSLFSAAGWFASAGWEQLTNGTPNYGTDSGAFGQRLGAAAVRGISEGVFSESLFAPLFHEDPRYYVLGPGHNFFKRAIYAGTRTIITRTDSGHATPNFALLAGNAAGSALTIPYYPARNTSFGQVAQTFGGSIGGSALGFVVNEFIVDALIDLHLKKRDQ